MNWAITRRKHGAVREETVATFTNLADSHEAWQQIKRDRPAGYVYRYWCPSNMAEYLMPIYTFTA